MTTEKNKTTNRTIKLIFIGLAILIAIPFGFGMYSGITSHTGTTGKLLTALEKECDCEEVRIDHSAYGLQISKSDGVSNQKVAYTLTNCSFKTNAKDFLSGFHQRRMSDLEGYIELDHIEFQFIDENERQLFTIKDGIIE